MVTRGTPAEEIDACLKSSRLWSSVTTVSSKTNMRAHNTGDASAEAFSQYLLSIGNGTHQAIDSCTDRIRLRQEFCHHVSSAKDMILNVYPDFVLNFRNNSWLAERAFLASTNDTTLSLNNDILDMIPGRSITFISINSTIDADHAVMYPTEFLNSIEDSSILSHLLKIRVGEPIISIRNIRPPILCNGTRLVVKSFRHNIIEAIIITGKYK